VEYGRWDMVEVEVENGRGGKRWRWKTVEVEYGRWDIVEVEVEVENGGGGIQ
jgi:hypothetical protein